MGAREMAHAAVWVRIQESHPEVQVRYGGPRIQTAFQSQQGFKTSIKTVAKIMRENRIRAKQAKKLPFTKDSNHSMAVAENILESCFEPKKTMRLGSRISLIFQPVRDGCIYQPLKTCAPGRLSRIHV